MQRERASMQAYTLSHILTMHHTAGLQPQAEPYRLQKHDKGLVRRCVGKPEVGSSMKTMEGLATSSTAIVSLLRCSTDKPVRPGIPT